MRTEETTVWTTHALRAGDGKPETVRFYWRRLPHWEVVGGRYFVTIRLKGAIPREGLERISRLRHQAEQAVSLGLDGLRERRAIFRQMEQWLHRREVARHLATPAVADMVVEALERRAANGTWTLFSYVVMPNHIHVFLRLGTDRAGSAGNDGPLSLDGVLYEFKRWTAMQANALLGRKGPFWQRDWFDHWSRSSEHDHRIEEYIRANPLNGGLVKDVHEWRWVK